MKHRIFSFVMAIAIIVSVLTGSVFAGNSVGTVKQITVNGDYGWYYVIDNQPQTKYTGVCNYCNEYGWWYVKNGKVDFSYTGFASNNYGTWYVQNGKVDFSQNNIIEGTVNGKTGWWYVVGGKVQTNYTGVSNYCNPYGWWYIRNGMVDFSVNSVENNNYGWWLIENGKVNFNYTGVSNYSNPYGWWYIENGKVNFNKTSIEENRYGWWRVVNGKVDFSCNSVKQNDYGWWYLLGGKVQFGYTGIVDYTNNYGWWYVKGGKVDFSFTGISNNKYGNWYVNNGKVNFNYNGNYYSGNTTWKVTDGKATATSSTNTSYKYQLAVAIDGATSNDVNVLNKTVDKYIPDYMAKAFQESEWTLYATSKSLHNYMDGLYTEAQTKEWYAVTWSDKKAIWFLDAYVNRDSNGYNLAVVHEFGHFWDYMAGYPSKTSAFSSAYSKESNALRKYDPSWYSTGYDATETYAEVFMSIILDESGIKKACPNLYSCVKDSMSESARVR